MHGDVRHPEVAGVIDGQPVGHVEHLRSPTIFRFARTSVNMQNDVFLDGTVGFVAKTIVAVEVSIEQRTMVILLTLSLVLVLPFARSTMEDDQFVVGLTQG